MLVQNSSWAHFLPLRFYYFTCDHVFKHHISRAWDLIFMFSLALQYPTRIF
jgi:hypothetical protein